MNSKLGTAALLVALLAGSAAGQATMRINLGPGGAQANAFSGVCDISGDGRFVVFHSAASNLVPGDTNGSWDVFLRDRVLGTTTRVSLDSNGAQGNGDSYNPTISANGRHVAFESVATNLVPGDTNALSDIFVRDLQAGVTRRVTVDSAGNQSARGGRSASMSADGRYVAFYSDSTDLVSGDVNNTWDAFVHDCTTGATILASTDSNGVLGNDVSGDARISSDGRFLCFASRATNLVPGDTNAAPDVFLRDLQTGLTTRVSIDSNGVQALGTSGDPRVSSDGHFVLFASGAMNLIPTGTNGELQIFLHDTQTGATALVSADSSGIQGYATSEWAHFSSDGRYVTFVSYADNLVPGDTNTWPDVFLRDVVLGQTTRVSVNLVGVQGNRRSGVDVHNSPSMSISADGRFVAFGSEATNLVPGDSNNLQDIFVHDARANGFTSLCDPGSAGVSACPCSNPPAGAGRGCDNSAASGGATLSASGIAYLSLDALVFETAGQTSNSLSVVVQGNALVPGGATFGQGCSCVGGTLKRLYVKQSLNGSIVAPDVDQGEIAVSAMSASLGDVIQPGQSRWYLVYYRDPNVLGGCPATSSFNATQTGCVQWSP